MIVRIGAETYQRAAEEARVAGMTISKWAGAACRENAGTEPRSHERERLDRIMRVDAPEGMTAEEVRRAILFKISLNLREIPNAVLDAEREIAAFWGETITLEEAEARVKARIQKMKESIKASFVNKKERKGQYEEEV